LNREASLLFSLEKRRSHCSPDKLPTNPCQLRHAVLLNDYAYACGANRINGSMRIVRLGPAVEPPADDRPNNGNWWKLEKTNASSSSTAKDIHRPLVRRVIHGTIH
jgi:hypothetical protein